MVKNGGCINLDKLQFRMQLIWISAVPNKADKLQNAEENVSLQISMSFGQSHKSNTVICLHLLLCIGCIGRESTVIMAGVKDNVGWVGGGVAILARLVYTVVVVFISTSFSLAHCIFALNFPFNGIVCVCVCFYCSTNKGGLILKLLWWHDVLMMSSTPVASRPCDDPYYSRMLCKWWMKSGFGDTMEKWCENYILDCICSSVLKDLLNVIQFTAVDLTNHFIIFFLLKTLFIADTN